MGTNIGNNTKNQSLNELETFIQQKEELLGPLIGLGHDKNQTVIEIDDDNDPPNKLAILKSTVGGEPVPVANHDFICKGTCFIDNKKQVLAAYRPK